MSKHSKKKSNKTKKPLIPVLLLCLLLFTVYLIISNNEIEVTEYDISDSRIGQPITIVQISDLHNKYFGTSQSVLSEKILNAKPDLIVITGDLIDRHTSDTSRAETTVKMLAEIAPVYYCNGNHEHVVPEQYKNIKSFMGTLGVTVLENESVRVKINGNTLVIAGINDPVFSLKMGAKDNEILKDEIDGLFLENDTFSLLLSHRPEVFDVCTDTHPDLILSGHNHGGMVRLPYVGGLFGGKNIVFPEYDDGLFRDPKNGSSMIVSRGLAGAGIIPRIFNPPELVIIHLKGT